MDVSLGQLSSMGPVRKNNEDYLGFLLPDDAQEARARGALAVIADGMGGQEDGEVASRLAVETALRKFREAKPGASPGQLLGQMFAAANQAVYDEGNKVGQQRRMGTTLTIAVFRNNEVTIGHVGDCRTYLIQNGVSSPPDDRPLLRRRAGEARPDLGRGSAAQPDAVDADAQHRQGPHRPGRLLQRRGRPRRPGDAVLRRAVLLRHREGDRGDRHALGAGRGVQAAHGAGRQARHGRQPVDPDRPGGSGGAAQLLPGGAGVPGGGGHDHEPRSPGRRRARQPLPRHRRRRPQRHGLGLQGRRSPDRQDGGPQGAVDAVRERPRLLHALPARGGDRPAARPPLHPPRRPDGGEEPAVHGDGVSGGPNAATADAQRGADAGGRTPSRSPAGSATRWTTCTRRT